MDATSTVCWTDEIPESGQTNCSITYAAGDLPNGNFTVRVNSFLTGSTAWTSSTATQGTGNKESVLQLVTTCG